MLDINQKLQLIIGQQIFQLVILEDELIKARARIAELEAEKEQGQSESQPPQ